MKYWLIFLVWGVFVSLPGDAHAQTETEVAVEYEPFDKAQWERITKNADYSEKGKKDEEIKDDLPKEAKESPSIFEGGMVKYVLYGLFALILIFVIYSIAFDRYGVSNTSIDLKEEVDIERIAENLPESELEQYLKKALNNQSYRTAVRLYYLMVIQGLSNKNFIRWKKDKTNRDYLNEMRQNEQFADFRKLTRIFEYIWYGEVNISEKDYRTIKPDFDHFLKSIDRQKVAS
ncbi:MAG: DUF4129 domain-containing protein [Bacteroidota bacterium]